MDRATLSRRLTGLGLPLQPPSRPDQPPVVAPESDQQAADLLGLCSREGWRVRVTGAGTRTAASDVADADLLLSASRLSGLEIYEPDDLTAGLLPGTTHAALDRTLAGNRQFLPLDPPCLAGATVGGSFASGGAGPLRAAFGTPRDLALGLRVITGDGRVLRLGGQVVKNVAGYDLVRLVVGSRGTLGLITQLHVRLRSLPASDVTLLGDVPAGREPAALAIALRDAIGPAALELLGPRTAVPAGGLPDAWKFAIRLQGGAATVAAAAAEVRRQLPAARELPDPVGFWSSLATAEAGASVRFQLAGRPTDLPALLEFARKLTDSRSGNDLGNWSGAAHATTGLLRLWAGESTPAAPPAAVEQDTNASWTCTCTRGPTALRERFASRPAEPAILRLETELRRRFDPAGILVGD